MSSGFGSADGGGVRSPTATASATLRAPFLPLAAVLTLILHRVMARGDM